jgi:hypothetical protein
LKKQLLSYIYEPSDFPRPNLILPSDFPRRNILGVTVLDD